MKLLWLYFKTSKVQRSISFLLLKFKNGFYIDRFEKISVEMLLVSFLLEKGTHRGHVHLVSFVPRIRPHSHYTPTQSEYNRMDSIWKTNRGCGRVCSVYLGLQNECFRLITWFVFPKRTGSGLLGSARLGGE